MSEAKQYQTVFQNAFGGAAQSPEPPLIHGKLLGLRQEIKSLAAEKKQGVMFPVRGAKDLNQKLANALNKLNLLAPVISQEFVHFMPNDIPFRKDRDGVLVPQYRTLTHCKATVRIIAEDGSYLDMVGSGHGGDPDDKAGGKASTYAWKDAILKGLSIPHEDMIDTDDDSPATAPAATRSVSGAGPAREPVASKAVSAMPAAVGGNSVYDDFTSRIRAAKTLGELAALQGEIKSGAVALAGKARLDAAAIFVEVKEALMAAGVTE